MSAITISCPTTGVSADVILTPLLLKVKTVLSQLPSMLATRY